MGIWDTYQSRIDAHGGSKRGAAMQREVRMINRKLPDNFSYQSVIMYDQAHGYNIAENGADTSGEERQLAIINSDNLNEKNIFSMPGEDIENGSLINWMDNYWIVTERDANTTVYTRAKIIQCNYLLRWVSDGNIYEQWCVIEDGTKYLTGEYEDRNFVVTRGDSRISMTIARNDITAGFFDRDMRFLIDDQASRLKLAYLLTKPLKVGWNYGGYGIYKFVLQEVNTTENDNQDLMIADYYKFFPRGWEADTGTQDGTTANGKKVWL